MSQKLGTFSAAVWLMGVALLGPAFEVFRDIRWSLSSPPGCPFGLIGLVLILTSACCFRFGISVGICLVSQRCRIWLWQCLAAAEQLWIHPGAGRRPRWFGNQATVSRVPCMSSVRSVLQRWIRDIWHCCFSLRPPPGVCI